MLQRACFLTMWIYIYILYWLVVGNILFICPCIGNNHPNRLIFFRGVETGYPSLWGYYHTIPVFCTPVLHPEVILLAISPMNVSIAVPLTGTYPISYSDVETKHCKHRWFSQHHEIVAHCTRWCPIVS